MWIKRTLKDKRMLPIFASYFFPRWIKGEIPDCHIDLINQLTSRTSGAIIFPRGFGKTTWERIDTIHDIVYGAEPVIVYISNKLDSAKEHFSAIKNQLEINEALQSVYGDFVPKDREKQKWTDTFIETNNGVTLIARGALKGRGVNIKGQRPTKIVIDDAEDDDMVRSSTQRQKFSRWVEQVIEPSLDPEKGYITMIGTLLHPLCYLKQFYDQNGGVFRQAIEDEKSIWPAVWSVEDLAKKRKKIGSIAFYCEYMNRPTDDGTRLVQADWIRLRTPPLDMRYYGAIDPAISKSDYADYSAISTVGRSPENYIYVVDVRRGRWSFHETVANVLYCQRSYSYRLFGVEKQQYQQALKEELEKQTRESGTFLPTRGLEADKDKVRRFQAVLPYIENGTVVFSPQIPQEFIDEMLLFPEGDHDDQVDSVVYAIQLALFHDPEDLEVLWA